MTEEADEQDVEYASEHPVLPGVLDAFGRGFAQHVVGGGLAFGLIAFLGHQLIDGLKQKDRELSDSIATYRAETIKIRDYVIDRNDYVIDRNNKLLETITDTRERLARIEAQTATTSIFFNEVRNTKKPIDLYPELKEIDLDTIGVGGPNADFEIVAGFPPIVDTTIPFDDTSALEEREALLVRRLKKELSGSPKYKFDPRKYEVEAWHNLTDRDGKFYYRIVVMVVELDRDR